MALTRDELIEEIELEINIGKHLHEKLSAADADYRPTPGQRSALELMRYLAVCGIAPAQGMLQGNVGAAKETWGRTAEMTFDEFPAAMERQREELRALLEGLSDTDLATGTAQFVTGETMTYGRLLVKSSLKWLTAYRMQLFLYAKSTGATHLNTLNNWVGIDQPAPAEAV